MTDADAVLGYLPAEGFAGGRMELDVDASRAAIERDVAGPLGIDVTEAAWGIERIVNANMANATRRVLASHGADPRTLALIAYGGNGAVHAWAIANELGVGRVLVPKAAPAFSALGVLVADSLVDLVRSYVTPLAQVDLPRLRSLMDEVTGEAVKELEPTGLGAAEMEHFVQMCYPGQNFDMSVATSSDVAEDDLIGLAERFHTQHERERGFCFRNQPPLIRGVRLVARVSTPKPQRFAALGDVTDPGAARIGSRPGVLRRGVRGHTGLRRSAPRPRRGDRGPRSRPGAVHGRRGAARRAAHARPDRQLRAAPLSRSRRTGRVVAAARRLPPASPSSGANSPRSAKA